MLKSIKDALLSMARALLSFFFFRFCMGMPVCSGAAIANLYIAAELAVLIAALLSEDGQPPPVWLFDKHRYSRRSLALLVLTVLHHRHSVPCSGDLAVRCKSTAETCSAYLLSETRCARVYIYWINLHITLMRCGCPLFLFFPFVFIDIFTHCNILE